jgi:hypothetical protein
MVFFFVLSRVFDVIVVLCANKWIQLVPNRGFCEVSCKVFARYCEISTGRQYFALSCKAVFCLSQTLDWTLRDFFTPLISPFQSR